MAVDFLEFLKMLEYLQEIRVAEGFRLFSTITTSKLEILSSIQGLIFYVTPSNFWTNLYYELLLILNFYFGIDFCLLVDCLKIF